MSDEWIIFIQLLVVGTVIGALGTLTGLALDAAPSSSAPRIGVCRTPWWDKADAATQALIESSAARFAAAGAKVSAVSLEPAFDRMNEIQIAFSSYEFYRALTHERTRHPGLISPSLTARLAAGGTVTRAAYEAAQADTRHCMALMARHFDACDMMWTQLGLPCITVPAGKGQGGLPLGVQLVAAAGNDAGLMRAAAWVERMLAAG